MGKIDFYLAANLALDSVQSWLSGGYVKNGRYWFLNPLRGDRTIGSCSIDLSTGVYADFADESFKGGDAVALWAQVHYCSQGDAAKQILDRYSMKPISNQPPKPQEEWVPIIPVPSDSPEVNFSCQHGKPSRFWRYSDPSGLWFFIARYETFDGKQIIPWSYCENTKTGAREWRKTRPKDKPLPLLGLLDLLKNPDAPVVVVEGEPCLDAARDALPFYVIITWCGGSNAYAKSDWSPMAGRSVLLWPDADDPGKKAMEGISAILRPIASRCDIINIPDTRPDAWDIADAIKDGEDLGEIMASIIPRVDPQPELIGSNTEEISTHESDMSIPSSLSRIKFPFRALGFDHTTHYFLSGRTGQVIPIEGARMGKSSFLQLAPLSSWEQEFKPEEKTRLDWDLAADYVLMLSEQAGPYDERRVRGRGAWWDAGRSVLHIGDRLIVNNVETHLADIESKFIYDHRAAIGSPRAQPATTEQAKQLLDIFKRFQWDNPLSGPFLAGWCSIAPICGALRWRPHVWLTGPSGSGKSFIQSDVIRPLLGRQSIFALGKSSEAGIRQKLAGDALPVVIDEAEQNDMRQRDNVRALLFLARGASSDGESHTYRGTVSGKSMSFDVRSCFLFSSIGVGITDHADESRVTVCTLKVDRSASRQETWNRLQIDLENILTPEFCESIRARMIKLIHIIRYNAQIFAAAAAHSFGSQRAGDQMGALFAGAYALVSDEKITNQKAADWIESKRPQIEAHKDMSDHRGDEEKLLQTLMGSIVQHQSNGFRTDITIGELVAKVRRDQSEPEHATLNRIGIRIDTASDIILIANNHSKLTELMNGSFQNYAKILRRLDYHIKHDSAVRFSPGVQMRAVGLPLSKILYDEEPKLLP